MNLLQIFLFSILSTFLILSSLLKFLRWKSKLLIWWNSIVCSWNCIRIVTWISMLNFYDGHPSHWCCLISSNKIVTWISNFGCLNCSRIVTWISTVKILTSTKNSICSMLKYNFASNKNPKTCANMIEETKTDSNTHISFWWMHFFFCLHSFIYTLPFLRFLKSKIKQKIHI